ncbi:MAG: TerB N-terminal domain-containing protein [Lachnospiraceae bacterium]|nr:TerB N-terminal domain-containing protein [Lachnospiraceae bacterium]
MSDTGKKTRMEEVDSFWDLSDMMPKKRPSGSRPFASDTGAAYVNVGETESVRTEPIPPRSEADKLRYASERIALASDKLRFAREALEAAGQGTEADKLRCASDKLRLAREALEAAQQRASVKKTMPDVSAPRHFAEDSSFAEITVTPVPDRGETKSEPVPKNAPGPALRRSGDPDGRRDLSDFTLKTEPTRPLLEYLPEDNPLLVKVSVYPWHSGTPYFGDFHAEVDRYLTGEPEETDYVPFFGYMPLPHTLEPAQKNYYLWFRDRVNAGEYPEADFSYLLLYTYEILILPDRIPPEEGIRRLSGMWGHYRERFPRLDAYLTEWVTDYCLIHRVSPDLTALSAALPEITRRSSLREFWLGLEKKDGDPLSSALYRYGSNYNWETSKYCDETTRPAFEKHMEAAFRFAFSRAGRDGSGRLRLKQMFHTRVIRETYLGAPCEYSVRRRLEIEYYSCTRSAELRFAVTDAVRYIENQIRALLGVKSRYRVAGLDPTLKEGIDLYFAPFRKRKAEEEAEKRREAREETRSPINEALYEALSTGFSEEEAKKIEENAWDTTERLVDAFSGEPDRDAFPAEIASVPFPGEETLPEAETAEEEEAAPPPADGNPVRAGFEALLAGENGRLNAIAKNANLLPDTLIEKMNLAAFDYLGDIAVEPDGDTGWRLIEDYKEEISGWMRR